MRLVPKLVLVILIAVTCVLAPFAYLQIERERRFFEEEKAKVGYAIGRTLRDAAAAVSAVEGSARALEVVRRVDDVTPDIGIRFVVTSSPRTSLGPWLSGDPRVRDARLGSIAAVGSTGDERMFTYVPTETHGSATSIEVSQSIAGERQYLRRSAVNIVLMSLLIALASIAVGFVFNAWFVGRPVALLLELARRVGEGDLSRRIELSQKDELGQLARELNATCERLRDAKERVERATAERLETLEQLRHADRLTTVGRLAAGVAHELGTPLHVVAGRARMILAREVSGAAAEDCARIIVEQADRMTRTIRELLDFARTRAFRREPIDLRSVAQATLALVTPLARKKGVAVQLRDGPPARALADPGQIQQALTNLIVNAIQAMPDGGEVTLEVERRSTPAERGDAGEREGWVLSVRDMGKGIPEGDLPRIFEPFFTTKDVGEGTGLGLSIAHSIALEHGGRITVESRPGEGSTFAIHLPAGGAA